jgi:hypothetical protein
MSQGRKSRPYLINEKLVFLVIVFSEVKSPNRHEQRMVSVKGTTFRLFRAKLSFSVQQRGGGAAITQPGTLQSSSDCSMHHSATMSSMATCIRPAFGNEL